MNTKTIFWKLFFVPAIIGSFAMTLFYTLLLWAITGDINHPLQQFLQLQPWMSLLIIGFGIQSGLYWLLRKGITLGTHTNQTNVMAGTSTSVSGISMIACCAHHMVDVLPILGISGAAVFLSQYQTEFLLLGVLINILGISMMLAILFGKSISIQKPLLKFIH